MQRSKHIDVKTKCINEYVEDGVLKIFYVKSEGNDAETFTRNLGSELHGMHTGKIVGERFRQCSNLQLEARSKHQ